MLDSSVIKGGLALVRTYGFQFEVCHERKKKLEAKGFQEGMRVEVKYWVERMNLMKYLEKGIKDRFQMGWGLNWVEG
ncbi:hypothetical protein Csa_011225 [Cucumis sativus]|uniref:Uncharacterized protein n=1 Tax=Cucumis sativus TaxID=3659 RepID=A0A0A0LA87_CUCSA|nr:hypothetical protein Csa_011225 [Cucumis sativus]